MLGYSARIYTSLTIINYKGGKNKMTQEQRMENDVATMDRRELADHIMRSSRNKNDELTIERRYKADKGSITGRAVQNSRNKNDELTIERRDKADQVMEEHREKNDELTMERREIKDRNPDMALAISLVLVIVLIGAIFFFI